MNSKGFTLLEILIALLIVTTVFMASYLSMTEMAKNTARLREKTFASLVASKEIIFMRLYNSKAVNGAQKSHMVGDISFFATVTRMPTAQNNIDEIEVVVTNKQGQTIITEKGYLFVEPQTI